MSQLPEQLLLLHGLVCLFLTGLIWTIQLVHYPSFLWIDHLSFTHFSDFHSSQITKIVFPAMLLELCTATILFFTPLLKEISLFLTTNLIFLLLIWASTFFLSMPCHKQLQIQRDPKKIEKLIRTNWPRTILWSLRSLIIGNCLLSLT